MAERLPPLNALRSFEVAARHLSFTKAAEELHVTHSAISHQIKAWRNGWESLFSAGSIGDFCSPNRARPI